MVLFKSNIFSYSNYMKSKLKKINKKTEEMFKASSVAVLLENVNHNIQIIAEGQDGLRDKMHKEIGNLRSEMKEEIGGLRYEVK
jgi:hypothetical protein